MYLVFTAKSLMMLVYSGGSYAVTPRKRSVTDKTKNLIRDVKRRSFRMSRNPQVNEKGGQRKTYREGNRQRKRKRQTMLETLFSTTKIFIRDVKRRSFRMSRNPQINEKGRQRENSR